MLKIIRKFTFRSIAILCIVMFFADIYACTAAIMDFNRRDFAAATLSGAAIK
jgi:hypothetical protein